MIFSKFKEFNEYNFEVDISCYLDKLDLLKNVTYLVFIIYQSAQEYRATSCLYSTKITPAVVTLGLIADLLDFKPKAGLSPYI